ncbi:MAG TPA: hypothetical protein VF692_12510 [Pyrinomonadaceae bacterium]
MKKLLLFVLLGIFAINVLAQSKDNNNEKNAPKTNTQSPAAIKSDAAPLELARIALKAHGGDKFKNMKTLVIRGTADVSGSPTQNFPSTFAFVSSGEKYRIDITNPFQPLKQVYDGEQTSSSINGFYFPPLNRIGLMLLTKFEEKDFTVAAVPEKTKTKNSFRITSPEGFYTDFFLDEKNGQVKSYKSSFEVSGRNVTTAVEIDKVRTVEGVLVPEKYAQRFELGNLSIYVDFKAKEISINTPVADDVFVLGK